MSYNQVERKVFDYQDTEILDDYPVDRKVSKSYVDSFGRLKINISAIWNETSLRHIKTKSNINIEHIEHTDDGDIYYLDI